MGVRSKPHSRKHKFHRGEGKFYTGYDTSVTPRFNSSQYVDELRVFRLAAASSDAPKGGSRKDYVHVRQIWEKLGN